MDNTILDYPEQNPHAFNYVRYGTFWERFAAAFIDGIIMQVVNYIVLFAIFGSLMLGGINATGMEDTSSFLARFALYYAIILTFNWLYCALLESSERQATVGKMALNLKVTDMNGDRITFGQATGRHFGKLLSALILFIGYIMVAFTDRNQGLHDMMAGTLVVKKF